MTATRVIGRFFGWIIDAIVGALALSEVHPNVLTFLGLLINIWAAFFVRRREGSARQALCGDRRGPVRHGGRPGGARNQSGHALWWFLRLRCSTGIPISEY